MPVAISDTSPLYYLTQIDRLDLLAQLFDVVYVTPAVQSELEDGRRLGLRVPDFDGLPWLRQMNVDNSVLVAVPSQLGAGETETITLALGHKIDIVLLDDAIARRFAIDSGLTVWGTLRVLLEAKRSGDIERIEPLVGNLADSGMWISEKIREKILMLAGEYD